MQSTYLDYWLDSRDLEIRDGNDGYFYVENNDAPEGYIVYASGLTPLEAAVSTKKSYRDRIDTPQAVRL